MAEPDQPFLNVPFGLLLALYPLIWLLDLSWWQLAPDVVIIAGLLPLSWVLASSFRPGGDRSIKGPSHTLLASALLTVGVLINQLTLMGLAWSWLAVVHVLPVSSISRARLWLLCSGAFPWVLVDGAAVGWLFRLSGAHVAGTLFEWMGMEVIARGTLVEIDGLPISVESACGGLQLLQVLMSGGIGLTLLRHPSGRSFWLMLVALPLLAWLANTLRIIVISAWGLAYGVESAAGAFHTWGAMLVVIAMLGLFLFCSDRLRRMIG